MHEVHLLGVPSLADYVDHVRRRAIGGDAVDESGLIEQWREAARHYERLAEEEAGEAERCAIQPIAVDRQPDLDRIVAAPDFAETFGSLPIAFGMVEIDRLVVFQPRILLDHAARFGRTIAAAKGARSRGDALFAMCLPLEADSPPIAGCNAGNGVYVFHSEHRDLRALPPRLMTAALPPSLSSAQVQAGVVVPIGFGARHLNVVRLAGRMVLNNGYHRAHALREAGFSHVPCVIQAVRHVGELAFAGASSLIDEAERLFESPRPPLMKDFFDPKLTTRLELQRSRQQIRISVRIETLSVPG